MFAGLGARILEALEGVPAAVGISLLDLATGGRWGYQEDREFPAASIVKIPILLAFYRQVAEGRLDPAETVAVRVRDHAGGAGVICELHDGVELSWEDLARLMIVVSDNTASNLLLERLGMGTVNSLMGRLGMGRSHLRRRFMEPPLRGENVTTPGDAARCLEALWRGEALSGRWREAALAILRRQQYREKIPLLLPPETVVAHKTGELEGVRHDAAIVELPHRPYVLVCLTSEGGPPWEVDLGLARISRICYDWFLSL